MTQTPTDAVTIVTDTHVVIGYLITYGPGPNEGCVEAFNAAGDIIGCYSDRARAAAALTARVGIWPMEGH